MADEIIAYFNGEWIPKSECKITMDNRGFRLGDAVFEVDRTYGGKFYNTDDHMDRLFRSLKYTRIDPGISREEMIGITNEAVERNWHLVPEGWGHERAADGHSRRRFFGQRRRPGDGVRVRVPDGLRPLRPPL